jgi:putative DNA primase/helicase
MGQGPSKGGGSMRAAEIHARVGTAWPDVLAQLGIPEKALRNKHGPCPACGGRDRFRFDNKRGRGDYICGQCGAGDGFKLLERVHGWPFSEARARVMQAAGLHAFAVPASGPITPPQRWHDAPPLAHPTDRVLRLLRGRCAVGDCPDAIDYLESRGLWPLPDGVELHAHPNVEYFEDGKRVGRFPALVGEIRDVAGELVSLHVTYLEGGRKLAKPDARKILSPLAGREGCAVRLHPATDELGIAEGIETAMSAAMFDGLPMWAALNTSLLARFEPPPGVTRLRIYADRDEAGLTAAIRLGERLQGRLRVETHIPRAPAKDWNDVLLKHAMKETTA